MQSLRLSHQQVLDIIEAQRAQGLTELAIWAIVKRAEIAAHAPGVMVPLFLLRLRAGSAGLVI
jgi:hypothetical protein